MTIFPGEPTLASFIGAKDDVNGGENWSYKTCKAPVKSSPTKQHPTFYRLDALPVAQQHAKTFTSFPTRTEKFRKSFIPYCLNLYD